ncbi:MAG: 50S ribosomal protein L9 [Patescibacteria group bacterium]
MIKVIFLKKVNQVANEGEVKEVSNGYAMNYLLPQGLAGLATPVKIRLWEQKNIQQQHQQKQQEHKFRKWQSLINGQIIEIIAKTSPAGKLFASVTTTQIIDQIYKKFDLQLSTKQLELPGNIKTVGEHQITVLFGSSHQAKIILKILSLNHD